jgi:hypothetical protein
MIELTDDQRQQLNEAEPMAVDPQTQQEYVLVRKEVYQRMKGLLEEDVVATGEQVDAVMAEDDANDPHLAEYHNA